MIRTTYLSRAILWKIVVFIATLLILGHMNLSFAQNGKVDINALAQETQKVSDSADEFTYIWWIPEEYWRAVFEQDPTMTAAQMEEFLQVLRPYMLILGVYGKVGKSGGITYMPKATIQNSIQVIDRQGIHYRPLSEEKIDADTKNFLSIMKPNYTNNLGAVGQNMHFFLFPAKDKKGHGIALAKKEGGFSVTVGKRECKWKLPLGSLLEQKVCSVDGEKLNGAWKFCPWHGVELK